MADEQNSHALKPPPFVWTPERIVLILDLSTEINGLEYERKTEFPDPMTRLDVLKRAITVFCRAKQALSRRHEFALWALIGTGTVKITDFSSNLEKLFSALATLEAKNHYGKFDMASVFRLLDENCPDLSSLESTSVTPEHLYRVILIFSRSLDIPYFSDTSARDRIVQNSFFFFDSVYVHAKASQDSKPQPIYDFLNDVVHHVTTGKSAYCLENTAKVSRVQTNFFKLLAHPLQRVFEQDDYESIGGSL